MPTMNDYEGPSVVSSIARADSSRTQSQLCAAFGRVDFRGGGVPGLKPA